MNAQQMWEKFGYPESAYEAWAFGEAPDELAELVNRGVKTGTSSAYALYELGDEPVPKAGDYSVILDSRGEAVCIIRNIRVSILAYRDVTEDEANKEGEGDRSLDYWRTVHENFFRNCMAEAGLSFSEDMLVVYEEFERVFP